jgi:hypothetical protein
MTITIALVGLALVAGALFVAERAFERLYDILYPIFEGLPRRIEDSLLPGATPAHAGEGTPGGNGAGGSSSK